MKERIRDYLRHPLAPIVIIVILFLITFCCFIFQNKPTENLGQCGNPITEQPRIEYGCVRSIDGHTLTLEDETGNLWLVEIGNPNEFIKDYYYCIFFNTMGTDDIKDDEIVKLWREVW